MATRSSSIRVTYRLRCSPGESPERRALAIALEQTVELPLECIPADIADGAVGEVRSLTPVATDLWDAEIRYEPPAGGEELPQLLNLLFGNVSLQDGVQVREVAWPAGLGAALPGPRYGIVGLRELGGWTESRPLLCAALKPVGASTLELGRRAAALARGGIDLVKDDHGLANQSSAPFRERLLRCQEAVGNANARTGGNTLYAPNLSRRREDLAASLDEAASAGCRAVLVSPLVLGLDTLRWIRESYELAILAHPALTGSFFGPERGILPEVLLGTIFRAAGSDAVIHPNVGGRFPFSAATCDAIHRHLRRPLGTAAPAFPMPGGGVDVRRVPEWVARYGNDTILLIGASLYRRGDLERAAGELLQATREAARAAPGRRRSVEPRQHEVGI